MNPATLLIIEAFLKYGPEVAKGIIAIFKKPDPTDADWEALFSIPAKSYEDYTKPK